MSEYSEQCVVIEWARLNEGCYPELHWLHSSLNGVKLHPVTAHKAKASGMVKGIFDLFLPVSRNGYSGLYIEMKVGRNKPTTEQYNFSQFIIDQGYRAVFSYGADAAIQVIEDYLR